MIAVFRQYLGLIRSDPEEISEQLPEDPTVLSHLVAATAALTVDDRQRLLAIDDTAARLRAELRLLNREAALLRQVRAVPVPLAELASPADTQLNSPGSGSGRSPGHRDQPASRVYMTAAPNAGSSRLPCGTGSTPSSQSPHRPAGRRVC